MTTSARVLPFVRTPHPVPEKASTRRLSHDREIVVAALPRASGLRWIGTIRRVRP